MKKLLAFVLLGVMLLSLCACGGAGSGTETPSAVQSNSSDTETQSGTETESAEAEPAFTTLALGEAASTDIWSVTVNSAIVDISVTYRGIQSGDQYEVSNHSAPVGSSLVMLCLTVENKDRVSKEFSLSPTFDYSGVQTTSGLTYGLELNRLDRERGKDWLRHKTSNVLMLAGECTDYVCHAEIKPETAEAVFPYSITFTLLDSSGNPNTFRYEITEEDSSLAYYAKEVKSARLFKQRIDRLTQLSDAEISAIIVGDWSMPSGLLYQVNADGTCSTSDGNSYTWSVEDGMFVLNGMGYEFYHIADNVYYLITPKEKTLSSYYGYLFYQN